MDTATGVVDSDPQETREWLDAMAGVLIHEGRGRVHYLLDEMLRQDEDDRGGYTAPTTTPYVNTIDADRQAPFPGNVEMELSLDSYLRWNAMVLVLRAGRHSGVGGHIATYASATTLYEIGFRHFFRGATDSFGGDMVFIQGHSSPGIYARAFMEGRLTEARMDLFRQETRGGLASYPRPAAAPAWLIAPRMARDIDYDLTADDRDGRASRHEREAPHRAMTFHY